MRVRVIRYEKFEVKVPPSVFHVGLEDFTDEFIRLRDIPQIAHYQGGKGSSWRFCGVACDLWNVSQPYEFIYKITLTHLLDLGRDLYLYLSTSPLVSFVPTYCCMLFVTTVYSILLLSVFTTSSYTLCTTIFLMFYCHIFFITTAYSFLLYCNICRDGLNRLPMEFTLARHQAGQLLSSSKLHRTDGTHPC